MKPKLKYLKLKYLKLKYLKFNPSLSRVGSLSAGFLHGIQHKVFASGLVGRSFFLPIPIELEDPVWSQFRSQRFSQLIELTWFGTNLG